MQFPTRLPSGTRVVQHMFKPSEQRESWLEWSWQEKTEGEELKAIEERKIVRV